MVAQKKQDNSYTTIAKSVKGYAATGNVRGKYTNPKALKLKTSSITLSEGKEKTIKGTVTKVKSKKKLMTSYAKKLRFVTDDPNVATVTSAGKVKAKAKGSCKIYVQTINGIWKVCKVTVE